MSRMNHGPLTKTKGKLGGVVFQQYEGMQVAREYQPVVKNPQSEKQVANRAKFKLSSQIVAQFKEVFTARLSLLSNYTRMRRAISVNAIYGVIDDSTPDNPQAVIDSVIAAVNAKSMSALEAPAFSVDGTALKVEAEEGDTVIIINCAYHPTKGDLVSRFVDTVIATDTPISVTTQDENRQVAMAVALHATSDAGRASISNITAKSDTWMNEVARSVAAGDIEVSNMSGYLLAPRA